MPISGLSGPGLSSTYDFTQITPTQIQSATAAMKANGTLTSSEADELSGLGSESSFSPIDRMGPSTDSNADWQSIKLNILSSLQNQISVGATEDLGQQGEQILSTDQSLLQKLSSYEAQNLGTDSSIATTGTLVDQSV